MSIMSTYSIPAPGRRGRTLNLHTEIILPLCAFAFLTSVSRTGLAFLPSTTEFAWGAAAVMLASAIVTSPNTFLALARRNPLLIAASLFPALSGLWSLTPGPSAYSGFLLFLNTLIGFLIADRVGLYRTITFIFWFCLFWQLASIVAIAGHISWASDFVGNARGVFLHKNAMALNAGMLYFTSIVLFASGWKSRLSILGIAVAIASILVTRSGTGILMAFFTTSVLIASGITAYGRRPALAFSGLSLIVGALAFAVVFANDLDVFGLALNALGKDETLTGRTILWEQAAKSFAEHPWLGVGYNSFWNSSETAASSIWIIMEQYLTSFHNVYIDRVVDVGAIGLSLFVLFMLNLLWRSYRGLLAEGSGVAAWSVTYICFIAVDSMSEYPIFWNSEFQLFLAIIAASTCGVALRSSAKFAVRPSSTRGN